MSNRPEKQGSHRTAYENNKKPILARGGKHAWENVKLAHHYCNTIKNNHEDYHRFMKRVKGIDVP